MLVVAPLRVPSIRPGLGGALALAALFGACSGESGASEAGSVRAAADEGAVKACEAGMALLMRGEGKQAEAEFERAIALDPDYAEGHFLLGQLRVKFSGEIVDSVNMPLARRNVEILERGIASILRATELDPENDHYAEWLGRAYHQGDDLVNARRWLEVATGLNPKNPEAHKRLGMVYLAIPEAELAKVTFEKAIQLEPQDANSRFYLGQVLEMRRDWPGARAAYEQAIENNPTQSEYYRKLMMVLERLGDERAVLAAEANLKRWTEYEAKVDRRTRTVNRNPRDATALRRLGEAYLEGGRWRVAVEWCTKAVRVDPMDVPAHLCCGIARRELGDFELSEKHLREAEFRAPEFLLPKLELVRLFARSKNDAALAELLAGVETEAAQDGATLFDLATVCKEVGREEDARRLFGKAEALGVTEAIESAPEELEPKTDAPSGGG